MRVTVYDKNPGPGFTQWFLRTSWLLGCVLQKLLRRVDDYHGAASWDDAVAWIRSRPSAITSLQFWGHGSPAQVWLAGKPMDPRLFRAIWSRLSNDAVVWFRCCNVIQGVAGHAWARAMVDHLGCRVAAHTRIVGPLQPGLHSLRPGETPSWPLDEGDPATPRWLPEWARPGPNTVTCLRTTVPDGW